MNKSPRLFVLLLVLGTIVACNAASTTPEPATATATSTIPISTNTAIIIPTSTAVPATLAATIPPATPTPVRQNITFKSGNLSLVGSLYKPAGAGPFPALIWNHGDEKDPVSGEGIDAIANIFVQAGYVVFAPMRRGQGGSQGNFIDDDVAQAQKTGGTQSAQKMFVQLMQSSQLDDQLAGLAYLKTLPYIDKSKLAVAGCSYGGTQAILAAQKTQDYKAAVAISPASANWDGNPLLQQVLTKAVNGINIPIFLIHPEKDVSVAPGYSLAQEFLKLNKPYSFKIYPPFGPANEQGFCFGGGKGSHWWAADVLTFLGKALSTGSNPNALTPPDSPITSQKITLMSDGVSLVGYVYKPKGPGPFPGIIWNHGSEQNPTDSNEFNRIASIFVPAGYVVVDPVRRGQGGSQGDYIDDKYKQIFSTQGKAAANQFLAQDFEGPELDDELAGYNYLKNLSFVDKNRLAVVGCSYGGIMTLLGAQSGADYKAAIALSPGAESWANPAVQQMLLKALSGINIPVLIMHPAQDASLGPGYTLGPQLQKLGKPYGLQIFPPFGNAVMHCFGGGVGSEGAQVWGPDALTFLKNVLH